MVVLCGCDCMFTGEFISEAVATFFATLVAGLTFTMLDINGDLNAALAIGLIVAILVYTEKAHLNPIVSIAVALTDASFGWASLFLRILGQLLGALIGGLVAVDGIRDTKLDFATTPAPMTATKALCFEILMAALLIMVVLRARKSVLYAFVHGLTYTAGIIAGESIFVSNALMNPFFACGLMLGSSSYDDTTDEGNLWMFLVGPFIGGLFGVVIFQLLTNLNDEDEYSSEEEYEETTVYDDTTKPDYEPKRPDYKPQPNPGYGPRPTPGYGQGPQVTGTSYETVPAPQGYGQPQRTVELVQRGVEY